MEFESYNDVVTRLEDCITDIFAILQIDDLDDYDKYLELSYRLALLVLQFK